MMQADSFKVPLLLNDFIQLRSESLRQTLSSYGSTNQLISLHYRGHLEENSLYLCLWLSFKNTLVKAEYLKRNE